MIKGECYRDGCPADDYFSRQENTIISKIEPSRINNKDAIRDYERIIMHHAPKNDELFEILTNNIITIINDHNVPLELRMLLARSWFSNNLNSAHSDNYNHVFSSAINMIDNSRESIQFIVDIFFIIIIEERLSNNNTFDLYYYIDNHMSFYDQQIRTRVAQLKLVDEFCKELSLVHIKNLPNGYTRDLFYDGLPQNYQLGIIL